MAYNHVRFSLPALWGDSKRWRFKVRGDMLGAGIGAGTGMLAKHLIWGSKGGALATLGAGAIGGGLGYLAGGYITDKVNRYRESRRAEAASKLVQSIGDADKREFVRQLVTVPENYREHVSGTLADMNMDNKVNSFIRDELKAHGVDASLVPVYDFPENDYFLKDRNDRYTVNEEAAVNDNTYVSDKRQLRKANPDTLLMTPLVNSAFRYGPGRYTLARRVLEGAEKARPGLSSSLRMNGLKDALVIMHDADYTPWGVPGKRGVEGRSYSIGSDYTGYIERKLGLSARKGDAMKRNAEIVNVHNAMLGRRKYMYTTADIRGTIDEETGHTLNAPKDNTDYKVGLDMDFHAPWDSVKVYEQLTPEFEEGLSAIKSLMHRMRNRNGSYMFSEHRPVTDGEALEFVRSGGFRREVERQKLSEYSCMTSKALAVADMINGEYPKYVIPEPDRKKMLRHFRELFRSVAMLGGRRRVRA